jgi:glycerol-3-phosphate dehydrogenase (NAD(P)+)
MIHLGGVMGSHRKAFLGTAGIGDLIATATSEKSRNYSCGKRIAEGEELTEIVESMEEVVEGLRSLQIAYYVIRKFKINAPIITAIYQIIYENKNIEKSVLDLMKYPFAADVDFD